MKSLALSIFLVLGASPVMAQNLTGLTPGVPSTATAATFVAKSSPGTVYAVTASNNTSTAGWLIGYNAIAAPADGALTPGLVLDCVALPASGSASVSAQFPPTNYSVGVTFILSSATTCYTKTTGVITGFIKALVR